MRYEIRRIWKKDEIVFEMSVQCTSDGENSQEVAEFCLFNKDFGRKYEWSCGISSFYLLRI